MDKQRLRTVSVPSAWTFHSARLVNRPPITLNSARYEAVILLNSSNLPNCCWRRLSANGRSSWANGVPETCAVQPNSSKQAVRYYLFVPTVEMNERTALSSQWRICLLRIAPAELTGQTQCQHKFNIIQNH